MNNLLKTVPLFFLLHFCTVAAICAQGNQPPVLSATGMQFYCPSTSLPIVESMTITDPDDNTTDAVYIQISAGYVSLQDQLTLTGVHPTITSTWNALTGKLKLESPIGIPVSYADFVAAIEDVVFTNSSTTPMGNRSFSITVGQANYLPSTDHYYEYVPALGISWNAAKAAAEMTTYYGLQGYLATVTNSDEAQLTGEQAAGAGWIGGSDEAVEGVWKWMTGPEVGITFWNGAVNGSTPTFAFWNTSEPNNLGDENYAHVTAPGVGIPGSWNDLPQAGSGGDYQPKGYIVEFGGMAGDPTINISTSTTLTVTAITSTTSVSRCGNGSVMISASSNTNIVNWYASPVGGTPLYTGNIFTTPPLTTTTIYYADASEPGCTATRTPVTATVNQQPVLTIAPVTPSCEGNLTFTASATAGIIYWYDSPTGETQLNTGTTFSTPNLSETTTYYAEAINNGCSSGPRQLAIAYIYDKPQVNNEEKILCENKSITLSAGPSGNIYFWTHSQETTRQVSVSEPGTYTVSVTSPAPESCTSIKTIIVTENLAPVIASVIVNETTVTITTSNVGDFEYSVDGVNFQSSNVFVVTEAGIHKAYVRERYNCGEDDQDFIILIVPSFFSPNNDMYNDFWTVEGITNYPNARIGIYDRYGKLIIELSQKNWLWDGTLDARQLPSTDYWYVLQIQSMPDKLGHFSLIR